MQDADWTAALLHAVAAGPGGRVGRRLLDRLEALPLSHHHRYPIYEQVGGQVQPAAWLLGPIPPHARIKICPMQRLFGPHTLSSSWALLISAAHTSCALSPAGSECWPCEGPGGCCIRAEGAPQGHPSHHRCWRHRGTSWVRQLGYAARGSCRRTKRGLLKAQPSCAQDCSTARRPHEAQCCCP